MQEFLATGRRKTAVARVFLRPGSGVITVNGRTAKDYFAREALQIVVQQPFELTGVSGQFDVRVNVRGGGVAAQAEAVRHGVTRALLLVNPEWRPVLKRAGFVRRDPREVV